MPVLCFVAVPAALALLLTVIFRGSAAVNAVPDPKTARAAAFLREYGWEIAADSCETAEVTVPERFGEVYEGYNALQKTQGFDLSPYRGRRLLRVTFTVTNYPGYEGSGLIRANVFLDGATVAAADLCSVELGGFIRGVTPSRQESRNAIDQSLWKRSGSTGSSPLN